MSTVYPRVTVSTLTNLTIGYLTAYAASQTV